MSHGNTGQRKKRRARPLEFSRRIERGLLTLGLLEGETVEGKLAVEPLRRAEASLDCRFSDEVLGLFAISELELMSDYDIGLDEAVETTERARSEGLLDDYVAIGQTDGETYLAVPKAPDETTAELLVFDTEGEGMTSISVARWLEEQIGKRRRVLREGDERQQALADASPTDMQLAKFRPTLIPTSRSTDRVRHPKFGVGTVLEERGAGDSKKFRVEFDDGTRTILAEFLEPVG